MTPEKTDAVASELKRIAQELNLSDSQKEQLKTHLTSTHARLQEYMQQNPNISRQEIVKKVASLRGSIREQIVKFLTPQQLAKWDAEVAKAKEFLGHKIAA
jgi:predicted HTH transcriptional regulator